MLAIYSVGMHATVKIYRDMICLLCESDHVITGLAGIILLKSYRKKHSFLQVYLHINGINCDLRLLVLYINILDLELTIDPAPPLQGEFSGLRFSYTLYHSEKKWLQNYVGALMSYGPLKYVTTSKNAIFCIFNTKTSMYQVI